MAKFKWVVGIAVIVALLTGSSAPFLVSTGPALAQDITPEKGTTGKMSARPAKMVLESPIEISRAEPPQEPAASQAGWQYIMTDGFEGAFPGVWSLYLDPGATDAYWGKDNYRSHSGSYSAFCAKSGTAGVNPPNHYPNNMDAWMIYGPFSLADATDAKVDFWLWLQSESDYDFVYCMASTDGTYFYGYSWCGDSAGWASRSFDLTNVYTLGNLCGQPQVWIAFIFTSDDTITNKGAFVDDIVLREYVTDGPSEVGWTFMAYLDGDNNLEGSEIASFNLMESAADNANVNIIVQIDRIPGHDSSNGDWTSTRRYKVKYDTDINNFASYTEGVDYWDLGELNMAAPNTLIDFVQWTKSNYPADHYCLVLANHGGGWQPLGVGQHVPKGILWDDTDGDYMSTTELGSALNSATSGGTEKLDVLFLDACLMQMIEVGYEVKDYSQYLVTSEYISWGPGPYHAYISSITATTTAQELATTIVNEYHNDLAGSMYAHTMSAVDLSQYGLASVVDDFAQKLTTGLSTYRTQIESSRTDCQKFDYDSYIDLYHFAFLINQNIADPTIQNAAQAVMTAVNNAVIAEAHESGSGGEYYALDNAHGISIYFPASEGDSGYSNYNSGNLEFVADKGWDEFLAAFFGESPTVTSVSIDAPAEVAPNSNFTADINISQVENLDTAGYDVVFDDTVLRLDDVTNGTIDGTVIPVGAWNLVDGRVTIVQNVPGLAGVTGSGTLAVLHFHVIGSAGDESAIDLQNGFLGDNTPAEIEATWIGDSVHVVTSAVLPGDANGDGVVNNLDITKVERIIVGLDAETPGADANQDGVVNNLDITKVERIIVGLD